MGTVMRIWPGGRTAAIHDDDYTATADGFGPPRRASNVEPIQAGSYAGWWFVDMSPLGPEFQYCLCPPQRRRDEALAAERRHLVDHWLLR